MIEMAELSDKDIFENQKCFDHQLWMCLKWKNTQSQQRDRIHRIHNGEPNESFRTEKYNIDK